MGTRADFYIGRGPEAEWIGSIAWDGYDISGFKIEQAKTEKTFRKRVAEFLASRDDGTKPEDGWPWPWDDSGLTDCVYAFENGKMFTKWKGAFPDMSERKAVTFGKRSGLIVVTGIVALLILVASATAQDRSVRGDVGGSVSGASQSFGYTGASYGVVGHVVWRQQDCHECHTKSRSGRWGFEAQGGWSVAHKSQTANGSSAHASAAFRYYFGRVFVAGGMIAAHQRTRLYVKSAAGPAGGIGYDDGTNTLALTVDKLLDENASVGYGGSYERLVRLSEHGYVSVRPFVTVSTFSTPHEAVSRRLSGVRAGLAIGIGRRF